MTRISAHYGLPAGLPFLDVHVERDNLLFLDPSAIRNNAQSDAYAQQAHDMLLSFFGEVLRRRTSSSSALQAGGLALLQRLNEPNETRLGMSARGVGGHGFGDGLGASLWDELATNAACREAAASRLEDLALFVDRVGSDLISDMTTRVTFSVLVEFTHVMMVQFPELSRGAREDGVQVWDGTTRTWSNRRVNLPYVAGRQLLLVPTGWVNWRLLMAPNPFYNNFGTETVQRERSARLPNGRVSRPSKRSLNYEFPDVKDLNTAQAAKYKRLDTDLVAQYRARVDEAYQPMSVAEILRRTA